MSPTGRPTPWPRNQPPCSKFLNKTVCRFCYVEYMARDESSREDLLRQATALVERIELSPRTTNLSTAASNQFDQRIVAGFRRDGALSIFFGEDPVYQFNAAGELRRAYCDGKLLKATCGRLAALERERTEHQVQLVRHELSSAEEAEFLSQMERRLKHLSRSIDANMFEVAGQVPTDVDLLSRLRNWLSTHDKWPIAAKPNA
jgi:hypothetical protein